MIFHRPIAILIVLVSGVLAAGPVRAQQPPPPQQSDQIAIQLGAIQLGLEIASATSSDKARALAQGRLALGATTATFPTINFVAATTPSPQSSEFREQLQQATIAALQNPVTDRISDSVTLHNGRVIRVTGNLNPGLTSASKIFNLVTLRLPNIPPGLVFDAIASSGNFGAAGSGPADANRIAERAMVNALTTYARGTRQWGPVSTASPSLPNFGTSTVNGVVPSLNGLMDAASAVAANSISALASGDPASLDPDATAAMTASLIKGAATFQKMSQTVVGGQTPRYGGALGATTTGLIAQFAGVAQGDWNNLATGDLLNAVVSGALTAAKNQFIAIGYGAAAGFAGTYTATGGTSLAVNTVAASILASFQGTQLVPSKRLPQLNAAIVAGLRAGLDAANWSDPVNGVAGIGGIKDFTVVNGTGAPLTDTVGL